jgi:predicted RNA-binding Zn ribbon-like protein
VTLRQLEIAAVLDLSPRQRRPAARPLRLELASDHLTLREVITRAVEVEVRGKEAREAAALGEILVVLFGHGAGAIEEWRSPSDLAGETEQALQAFAEGRYRVFMDGRPVTDLDERLAVGLRSQVTFVRVVPLVSG